MNGEKKENISIWDKVAPSFGKIGPKYWCRFGKRLVELSSIDSGMKVLDIGTGRGASLFPAIEKVGKEGYVTGIDNSEVMVSETNKDILARNICNAKVEIKNAQSLDFGDNYFDNVICGFGIGYLLFSESKLSGVVRVLKSSGQAGFSIWGIQEDQKWLTEIVNSYLPIDLSNKNNSKKSDIPKFDTVQNISKILEDSGLHNIRVYEEDSDIVYKSKEEWWQEMWSNAVRGIFEQLEALGSDTFEAFKKEIFKGLEAYYRNDGYHFNMPVIYAFGEKQ